MKIATPDAYRVVMVLGGSYRHLGAETWGGVTACGVKFRWPSAPAGTANTKPRAMIERVGTVSIGCLRCTRSRSYAMAQVILAGNGVTL